MKNYHLYIVILVLGIISCEPELENSVDEPGHYSSEEVDFSNYVALGNSMTAGYADDALYITGQKNSYPNIIARQFALTQDSANFILPLMRDNTGGMLLGGNQITNNRLVLSVISGDTLPRIYTGKDPTTEVTDKIEGSVSNMGVPGAKIYHLVAPGYGSVTGIPAGTANPYFVRFSSSSETTILEDAVAQDPTFFSLWIGNGDLLNYALSGGTGEFRINETNPAMYEKNDITDPNLFAAIYTQLADGLISNGADGILITIPDITSSPFFTTIPNNALELDAETAAHLTTYFQTISQIFSRDLIQQGLDEEQAQTLAAQYAIDFDLGANRFIIDVPQTEENPLGFRQMTEDELLVLNIDQSALMQGYGSVMLSAEVMEVLQLLQAGEQPSHQQVNLLFDAVSGINDEDALDQKELQNIYHAQSAYNAAIEAIANAYGLALFDAEALMKQVADGGVPYDSGILTSEFIQGGAFSLDGLHPTPRGHAALANGIISEINTTYNSNVPKVNVGEYSTVTLNNNVQ